MLRSPVSLAAITATLMLAAVAHAQQPAPVAGDLGGGALLSPPAPKLGAGNMVIALRTDGGSPSVQIDATIIARCASGTVTVTAPVAPDGTFSTFGAVRQGATRMRYELRGTLAASASSGTASGVFERTAGNRTRRCSARGVRWEARPTPGASGVAAAARPAATLFGLTDQAPRRGVVLRTSADGRSLSRALYGVTLRCTDGFVSPAFDLPRDDLAILPDGRVSDREAGTRRTTTSILKYVERFAATLDSGGADGMFSVELSVRRRATGKRITRCRSGVVRWSGSY